MRPITCGCDHCGVPILSYDPAWTDPKSSWWVKARRAETHIAELDRLVNAYRESEPFSLTSEPTDKPERTAYRLRFSTPVPIEISAVVGDILNNLRGALESLTYEMARLGVGGTFADADQERTATFPICATPEAFDEFFKRCEGKKKGALAFTDQAKDALRQAQPFINIEQAGGPDVMEFSYEDWLPLSELYRLHTMWNIDKHRRLAVVAWRPDLIWWGGDGVQQLLDGEATFVDDSVLLYTEGRDTEIHVEYKLVLIDDPARTVGTFGPAEDVTEVVARMYDHIVNAVVFPRIFHVMSATA